MRLAIALAAAIATVAAFAGPHGDIASACSCARVDPARDIPRFDAAFVGTPLSQHPARGQVAWTFDVERAVKGALPSPIVVTAPRGGGACGLELDIGQRTGLLLHVDGTKYESALCYQADPDQLARFSTTGARVLGANKNQSNWPWWPIVVGVGALITLTFAFLGLRRRRT